MAKTARSARGEMVDFDLLEIRNKLASAPVPVSVDERRKFINDKDGVKLKNITLPSALAGITNLEDLIDNDEELEV